MMGGASSRRGLWLDPRTKILLLLFCILSAMMAPSLFYELGLVVLIGLLGVCFGKWKYAWKGVLFYALIVLLTLWIMDTMTGTWRTMFIAFLGLFHKVYPCGMLSGIVLSTTKVSEFLSAMNRIHAPKKLVIPLAVMLRYVFISSRQYSLPISRKQIIVCLDSLSQFTINGANTTFHKRWSKVRLQSRIRTTLSNHPFAYIADGINIKMR